MVAANENYLDTADEFTGFTGWAEVSSFVPTEALGGRAVFWMLSSGKPHTNKPDRQEGWGKGLNGGIRRVCAGRAGCGVVPGKKFFAKPGKQSTQGIGGGAAWGAGQANQSS